MNANRATSCRLALSAAAALVLTASLAAAPVPVRPDPGDLQFLPDGSNAIIVLRLDQLLTSDGFKQLKEFQPEMEKGFAGQFGVSMSRVERMTIGGNVKGQPVMVLRLKEAATALAIQTELSKPRFSGDKGVTFREEKVGAFTLYNAGEGNRHCFCLADDRTLLVSGVKDLKPVLERGAKKPEFGDGMKAALKEMDAGAAAAFAIDMPSAMAAEKNFVPPPNPLIDVTQVAKSVDALVGSARLGKNKELSVRLAAVCKDVKSAEEAKKVADAGLVTATALLKDAPKEVPPVLRTLPSLVKTATKSNVAEATATTSQDTVVELMKALFMGKTAPAPNPKGPPAVEPLPDKP